MTVHEPTHSNHHLIDLEDLHGAHNYKPLDVVIERARRRLGL